MRNQKLTCISLYNLKTKKKYEYDLEEHSHINILTQCQIKQIIQYYEPEEDYNKMSMQINLGEAWQFITPNFSFNLWYSNVNAVQIRYKFYSSCSLDQQQKKQLQASMKKLEENAQKFERKFNVKGIDINLVWGSPINNYRKKQNTNTNKANRDKAKQDKENQVRWTLATQKYFREVCDVLVQRKKVIFLRNILLNSDSFKLWNQYSIVYLMCHTEQQIENINNEKARNTYKKNQEAIPQNQNIRLQGNEKKICDQQTKIKNDIQKKESDNILQIKEKNQQKLISQQKKIRNITQKKQEIKIQEENQAQKPQKRKYFVGDNQQGIKQRIFPEDLQNMLKNKKIKLLILHTSYPFYHLQHIQECEGIQNILLINSNPIYKSDSCTLFLKLFFTQILQGRSIKISFKQALDYVQRKFKNDGICCCYHQHNNKKCIFYSKKFAKIRFDSHHYGLHYLNRKQNQHQELCCKNIQDYKQFHSIKKKYVLLTKNQIDENIQFKFQSSKSQRIQGDGDYIKGFQFRQNLLGNFSIYEKVLKLFCKKRKQVSKIKNTKIFNLYCEIGNIKQIFFDVLLKFLIRRKVFAQVQTYHEFRTLCRQIVYNEAENKSTVYALFCQKIDQEMIRKLNKLNISLFIISDKDIKQNHPKPESINKLIQQTVVYDSARINPLSSFEALNFIKAQKHLSEQMKWSTKCFFSKIWKVNHYPTSFDYEGLMAVISETIIFKDQQQMNKQIKKFGLSPQKNEKAFLSYVIFMSVAKELQKSKQIGKLKLLKQLNFINNDIVTNEQKKKRMQTHLKYFNYTLLFYSKQVTEKLPSILLNFYKLTLPEKQKNSESNYGILLYDTTSDSKSSLISKQILLLLKDDPQFINDEESYLRDADKNTNNNSKISGINMNARLKAALKLVRYTLSCFYYYDVDFPTQNPHEINNQSQKQFSQINLRRKQKILILCLLIINNAIIFRKGSLSCKIDRQQLIKQEKSQQKKTQVEDNNGFQQFEQVLSEDQEQQLSNQLDRNSMFTRQASSINYENRQNQRFIPLENFAYEEDFINEQFFKNSHIQQSKPKPSKQEQTQQQKKGITKKQLLFTTSRMSVKGLIYLLRKIKLKNQSLMISAISQTFIVQLLLEEVYYNIQYAPNKLQKQLLYLIIFIRQCGQAQSIIKRRLLYDMMMCLITIYTSGGRWKLTDEGLTNIKNNFKIAAKTYLKGTESGSDFLQSNVLRIVQKICLTQQIFLKFKEYIRICIGPNTAEFKDEKIIQGYEDIIDKYEQFQQYKSKQLQIQDQQRKKIIKINRSLKMGKYYLNLIKLLKKINEAQQSKKQYQNSSMKKMLRNLKNRIVSELSVMQEKLLVVLTTDPEKQKNFMVNTLELLKKQLYSSQFQSEIETASPKYKQIAIVVMYASKQNLEALSERKYKYLIVNQLNMQSPVIDMKKGKGKRKGNEENPKTQMMEIISKIKCDYIFLCVLGSSQLKTELQHYLNDKETNIIYFDKIPKQSLYQAEINVFMIVVARIIAQRLQNGSNLSKAIETTQELLDFSFLKDENKNNNLQVAELAKKKSERQQQQQYLKAMQDQKRFKIMNQAIKQDEQNKDSQQTQMKTLTKAFSQNIDVQSSQVNPSTLLKSYSQVTPKKLQQDIMSNSSKSSRNVNRDWSKVKNEIQQVNNIIHDILKISCNKVIKYISAKQDNKQNNGCGVGFPIKIQIDPCLLIKKMDLQEIRNALKPEYALKGSKLNKSRYTIKTKVHLNTYIDYLKFYFKQALRYQTYIIQDDLGNQFLFNQILKILPDYYLNKKVVLIIKKLSISSQNIWKQKLIISTFAKQSQEDYQNQFFNTVIKIGDDLCLIHKKDQKQNKNEENLSQVE